MTGSLHGYWRKCIVEFDRRQRKRIDGILDLFLVEPLEGAKKKNIPTKILTTNPSSVTVQG